MEISQRKFGELEGKEITAYLLKNDSGLELTCLDYGCIITELIVPDSRGERENIVLGFDTIEEYQKYSPYFGAVIGRVAGRIGNGEFELDGELYKLPQNEGTNHLHGGIIGFDKVIWEVETINENDRVGLEFTHFSPDGDQGYPGNVTVKVTYMINNDNQLIISYEGETDKKTLLNLTNHSYFNLSGNLKRDVLEHVLTLKSDQFMELEDNLLPTGNLIDVKDTSFDFREGRALKDGPKSTHPQALLKNGYDHPFILNTNNNNEIEVTDPESGRMMTIESTERCVVFYQGLYLDGNFKIRDVSSRKFLGFCLEPQIAPAPVHHPDFPSYILDKGERYTAETTYSFTIKK